MISNERLIQMLNSYIDFDLEATEPSYVRYILTDVCGCSWEEIVELGFDGLWPDGLCGENNNE